MKLTKEDNMKAIEHGEVWLHPIAKMPKGKVQTVNMVMVAHSETGHHHVLEGTDIQIIEDNKELFIRLFKPAKLVHKKDTDFHQTLTVEPGVYEVHKKTEYNPFEKVLQDVMD